jgi:carbohydrate kinase (thermoresistant glucokinase family)
MNTMNRTPVETTYPPVGVIVMGVAGCGKSTIGQGLADRTGGTFVDADDLHPVSNKMKMASAQPLTDDDRWPWLRAVGAVLHDAELQATVVVACSALRRTYRDLLRTSAGRPLVFVHLSGTRELHAERLRARTGHFMPSVLLDTQLAILEPLDADENGIVIDIANRPEAIVAAVLETLAASDRAAHQVTPHVAENGRRTH